MTPGFRPSTETPTAYSSFMSLELGDILTLPDQRQLTVRALERRLSVPVGSMSGFILAGEVGPQATLVSIPASPDGPVVLYTPLDFVPTHARDAVVRCQGVVSYWAPHLPNVSGAMGELGYKVCAVRGQIDPMVLLWRGRERVVFVKSAVASLSQFGVMCLNRDPASTEREQTRHAARITDPANVPLEVPVTEHAGDLYRQFVGR